MAAPALRRRLSFTLLTLYGLGTTIGAGIYVLIGKVAASAGLFAPLSFLIAALLAAFTALTFGELAARYPKSAGEAVYVEAAFGRPAFSFAVGLSVALVGLVSCAAIVSGVVGYLQNLVQLPGWFIVLAVIGLLAVIAAWGIAESVIVAAVVTVLEIGGLLVILWVGRDAFMQAPATAEVFRENWAVAGWTGLASGAVLAFYAFIGFEDMVNVAEEVKDPEHTYPKAIAVTLVVTALLYVGISVVAVSALSLEDLAASKAPLSALFAELSGLPTYSVDALATVAVVNGALIQIIMASRVIYGLASQGWLPAALGRINERTRTPVRATVLSAFVVVVFAFALTLVTLAKATSLITLLIFAIVNLALVRLGGRSESPSAKKYYFPRWVPFLGFVFSLGFALFQIAEFLGVFARA
jgi:amino acid transporter